MTEPVPGGGRSGRYQDYFTTHIRDRKGLPSKREFEARARGYDIQLRSVLPDDASARVIDVGCGTGHVLYWLQTRGFALAEGIDISPQQVEQARRMGLQNVRCVGLEEHFQDRRDLYDLILLRDVLEHFSPSEAEHNLELLSNALRPHGRLLIQVPNAEYPFFGFYRYGDVTHHVAYTRSSIQQLLLRKGFGTIRFLNRVSTAHRITRFVAYLFLWKAFGLQVPSRSLVLDANLVVSCTRPRPPGAGPNRGG